MVVVYGRDMSLTRDVLEPERGIGADPEWLTVRSCAVRGIRKLLGTPKECIFLLRDMHLKSPLHEGVRI